MALQNESLIKIKNLLLTEEGYRQFPYIDSTGNETIGIGRNLKTKGISKQEALDLLQYDISECEDNLLKNLGFFSLLDEVRKCVLIDMTFNMGILKLLSFKNTLDLIKNKNYSGAADNMLSSEWAKEVGNRAVVLSKMMRDGQWI